MRNYFTNNELTDSTTAKRLGIKNEPSKEQWLNLFAIRDNVLNPLRRNSASLYASRAVFALRTQQTVGGKANKPTQKAELVDITAVNKADNKELFELCKTLDFDQLIDRQSNLDTYLL